MQTGEISQLMDQLDEIKLSISEQEYLNMANNLKKIFENNQYNLEYIKNMQESPPQLTYDSKSLSVRFAFAIVSLYGCCYRISNDLIKNVILQILNFVLGLLLLIWFVLLCCVHIVLSSIQYIAIIASQNYISQILDLIIGIILYVFITFICILVHNNVIIILPDLKLHLIKQQEIIIKRLAFICQNQLNTIS